LRSSLSDVQQNCVTQLVSNLNRQKHNDPMITNSLSQ